MGPLRFALFLLLPASLAAQQSKVLPDGFGYDQRVGAHPFASIWSKPEVRNLQIFAAASTNIRTAILTEIQYRRASSATYVAAQRTVTLRLGYTDHDPTTMPARFSAVPKQPLTTVFTGTVNLPLSTPPIGLPASELSVKLSTPYFSSTERPATSSST
jgi:hypothetical protein